MSPEYDDDEVPDYGLDDEDTAEAILDDIGVTNYENVEKILNQPEMTEQKNKAYLNKIIKDAEFKRNQLKALKGNVTKQLQSGKISQNESQITIKE